MTRLPTGESFCEERTTNGIEGYWGHSKRLRRKSHGRKKLTLDFQSLPEEYMSKTRLGGLVPNLNNSRYVELVLGDLTQLPSKLAEAGATAGPFSHWARKDLHLNLGRLPKRLLRKENLINRLLNVWVAQQN